eukprot:jgi/Hompol1/3173/HPOL_003147-RA
MRGVRFAQTGAADVLAVVSDLLKPAPAAGQVLVRNAFAGVNFIDTYHRSGLYKVPLPYTPGREASGFVEAIGEGVQEYKVGDRVIHASPNCYAEFSVVSTDNVVHLPEEISLEVGASLLLQGLTGMALTRIAHKVLPTETVLIYAAAGGTGQMLVQLCRQIGATVIGVTSTPDKAKLAFEAGADHVITYSTEDIVSRVMDITQGQGVHAVFDGVGKSTFDTSLACLRRLGSMLSFGNASGTVEPVNIMKLAPKQIRLMRPSLFGLVTTREEFQPLAQELVQLAKEGKVKVTYQVLDLADAVKAHQQLESGKTLGKLILKI